MSSSRPLSFLSLGGLMATLAMFGGAILFCFDPSGYSFFPICMFHRTTGLLCPGCGSLRALHQLLHGHLLIAFHFNPLLLLCLPLLGWYVALCAARKLANLQVPFHETRLASELRKSPPLPFARRKCSGEGPAFPIRPLWFWLFLAAALTFTVWRNLPGFPIPLPS